MHVRFCHKIKKKILTRTHFVNGLSLPLPSLLDPVVEDLAGAQLNFKTPLPCGYTPPRRVHMHVRDAWSCLGHACTGHTYTTHHSLSGEHPDLGDATGDAALSPPHFLLPAPATFLSIKMEGRGEKLWKKIDFFTPRASKCYSLLL